MGLYDPAALLVMIMGQLDLLVKPSFSNNDPKYSDWLNGTTKAELVMINKIKA